MSDPAARPADPVISIVVPVLDEERCVDELAHRVRDAMRAAGISYELVFVDDGSTDRTAERIGMIRKSDPAVKSIRFTRSFGHQAALVAGLEHARGDATVTMDGDLQHPPELIPDLVEAWRAGADVVQTLRRPPAGQRGGIKELFSRAFYAAMQFLSRVPVEAGSADFRLLDRRVVEAFNELQERFVFARGLVPWLGFEETRIEYRVGDRHAGDSKYSWLRMFRLALDGIFSFSVFPLRVIALIGLATTLFGVAFGVFSLAAYLRGQIEVPGWTTVVVLILIFGGIQIFSIGIVSEYVGRIYEEAKRRPRYVIRSKSGLDES